MEWSCREINERWEEFLYLELDEPRQSLFAQHLKHCPACRAEEARWRELLAQFDALAVADGTTVVPPELVFRVKRQVRFYEDWSRQTTAQFRHWLVGTAAVVLLLIGGVWFGIRQLQDPQIRAALLKPITYMVMNNFVNTSAFLETRSEAELTKAGVKPEEKMNLSRQLDILAGGIPPRIPASSAGKPAEPSS